MSSDQRWYVTLLKRISIKFLIKKCCVALLIHDFANNSQINNCDVSLFNAYFINQPL